MRLQGFRRADLARRMRDAGSLVRIRELLAERAPSSVRTVGHALFQTGRRIGYARSRWPRPLGTRPPVRLAVCAIFRDEAPYLAEWVSFHRLQGVERFWLYDNRSEDNWQEVLAPELDRGVVEVTPWPDRPGQLPAYADCLKRHRREARWIAFIDLDEFLFSPTGLRLPQVLDHHRAVPAVCVNWRVFGLGGNRDGSARLVTESHLWRVRDSLPINTQIKSIVYPRQALYPYNPHRFRHRHGHTVGETGEPLRDALRDPPTADLLRINHYVARSLAEVRYKSARPDAAASQRNRQEEESYYLDALDEVDGVSVPRDEVRDETILQFMPALKDALMSRSELSPPGISA